MIPASYINVDWRNTTPVDHKSETIGIGLQMQDGKVIRVQLGIDCALDMVKSVFEFIENYERTRSHSPKSSGMPSSLGSTPEDGQNV